jgi:hypothetical protein
VGRVVYRIGDEQPTTVSRLHELVRLAVAVTGRGELHDDFTGTVSLPMGTTWKTVDPYYGSVWLGSNDCEDAVEVETVLAELERELERRLLAFDERIAVARDECAEATFDGPMDHILPKR